MSVPLRERMTTVPSAQRPTKLRKPSHFGSATKPLGIRADEVGAVSIGSLGSCIMFAA